MLVDLSRAVGAYLQDVFITKLDWWVFLGFVAQGLFTMRFVVQWIASERAGRSVIPVGFWYFSIAGGLLLLVYALTARIRSSSPARRSASSSICAISISSCTNENGGSVSGLSRRPPRRGDNGRLTGVIHAGVSPLPQTSPITPLPRQWPLSSTP